MEISENSHVKLGYIDFINIYWQKSLSSLFEHMNIIFLKLWLTYFHGGRTGLMVRASDSGSGDPGSILGRVGVFVSLSKRHLLPKSTGNTQE